MSQSEVLPSSSWQLPDPGRVGMFALIAAESAIFIIVLVAYIFYLGRHLSYPTPRQILQPPYLFSICLISSSFTIQRAIVALRDKNLRLFGIWWLSTIILGAIFIGGTLREWHHLIFERGFTISSSVFGTTYYSLVGLHGIHVVVGLFLMGIVMAFTWAGKMDSRYLGRTEVLSLYWHFVDVVWLVVFTVVYIIGRS